LNPGREELVANVREGDVLAGKYRIERVLGIGGMGIVVAARHTQLDAAVAIKLLLPEMLASPTAVARFAREARAASKMTSEHVTRIFDVGELENGAPYIVMELLDGIDLHEMLKQRGTLPAEQAVDFILQTCVAVADAHALGIVHRDLKPANLFCARRSDGEPVIKVLDFGISKLSDLGAGVPMMSVTQTAAVMGTPLYMSPEQMRSAKDVDSRTDLWALGVILFQLVTGTVPFHGQTLTDVAVKVATEPAPNLRAVCASAPAGLEVVVFRCLEKDPRSRYQNVAELALALLPFAPVRARPLVERISGTVRRAGPSIPSTSPEPHPSRELTQLAPGSPETGAPWAAPRGEPGSRRTAALVTVFGLVIVAGATTRWWLTKPGDTHPPALQAPAEARTSIADGVLDAVSSAPPAETVVAHESRSELEAPAYASALDAGSPVFLPAASSGPLRRPAPSPRAISTARPGPAPSGKNDLNAHTAKPDCDPPYTLDDQGQKHFKHECYR
jgi:eukaryotic-like serine/threonine-protein kinase